MDEPDVGVQKVNVEFTLSTPSSASVRLWVEADERGITSSWGISDGVAQLDYIDHEHVRMSRAEVYAAIEVASDALESLDFIDEVER